MEADFHKKIEELIRKDGRYKPDAYEFMMQALWFTQKRLNRSAHVTARELLEGVRDYGLSHYGPMTRSVFEHWGIRCTDDFGEIVFNMIDSGLMKKSENDSRLDFQDVYSFEEALDIFRVNKK
ncbi:MAG: Minf_1886 family protein [Candidatus Omnitrophota bacterium]